MLHKIIIVAVLATSIIACASVPMAEQQQDAAVKTFSTKPDVAGIYIYRNEIFGAAISMAILIDGKNIGKTASKTFFYHEVQPGRHKISSIASNTFQLNIDTIAGKIYYVWQEVTMGMFGARTNLYLVSEEKGRKGVLESKLVKSIQ